jgi:hypothetical protein
MVPKVRPNQTPQKPPSSVSEIKELEVSLLVVGLLFAAGGALVLSLNTKHVLSLKQGFRVGGSIGAGLGAVCLLAGTILLMKGCFITNKEEVGAGEGPKPPHVDDMLKEQKLPADPKPAAPIDPVSNVSVKRKKWVLPQDGDHSFALASIDDTPDVISTKVRLCAMYDLGVKVYHDMQKDLTQSLKEAKKFQAHLEKHCDGVKEQEVFSDLVFPKFKNPEKFKSLQQLVASIIEIEEAVKHSSEAFDRLVPFIQQTHDRYKTDTRVLTRVPTAFKSSLEVIGKHLDLLEASKIEKFIIKHNKQFEQERENVKFKIEQLKELVKGHNDKVKGARKRFTDKVRLSPYPQNVKKRIQKKLESDFKQVEDQINVIILDISNSENNLKKALSKEMVKRSLLLTYHDTQKPGKLIIDFLQNIDHTIETEGVKLD